MWQRVPIDDIRILHPRREAVLATAYSIFYVAAAYMTGLAIRRWPMPLFGSAHFSDDAWYVLVFKLGLLLAVPVVVLDRLGYTARQVIPAWRFSAWVPLAFFAGLALNMMNASTLRAALARGSAGSILVASGLALVLAFATAAVPEELYFRVLLQTRLEAACGRVAAVLTTAVLFTAWHLPTRYLLSHGVEGTAGDLSSVVVGTGVPAFVVGIVFGLLWDRYRDAAVLIALHAGIDTLPGLWSILGVTH